MRIYYGTAPTVPNPPPPPLPSSLRHPPKEPSLPEGPLVVRLIESGIGGHCLKCYSSMKTKWLFFSTGKCISPECENYYDRKPKSLYDRGKK